MSNLLNTGYQFLQCDDRILNSTFRLKDIWAEFTDVLWPRSRGQGSGYLRESIRFAPMDIVSGTSPHWVSGDSAWQIKYVLTLNALRFNDFYIANKTAGTITYEEGKLTDENDNDISGLTSGDLLEEGVIEMTEGLSAKWAVEIKDTYFP